MFKVNNKHMMSSDAFTASLEQITYIVVDFKQVNVSWVMQLSISALRNPCSKKLHKIPRKTLVVDSFTDKKKFCEKCCPGNFVETSE